MLVRQPRQGTAVHGTLTDPGSAYSCDTLENAGRAIAAGTYDLGFFDSTRFQMVVPEVKVPGHTAILIHQGNHSAQSDGCILPGTYRGVDVVENSETEVRAIVNLMRNNPPNTLTIR